MSATNLTATDVITPERATLVYRDDASRRQRERQAIRDQQANRKDD